MESREELQAQRRHIEAELAKITRTTYYDAKWAPGVTDQFKSESREFTNYTDPDKARRLNEELKSVNDKIKNYAYYCQQERAAEQAAYESRHKNDPKPLKDRFSQAKTDAMWRKRHAKGLEKVLYALTFQDAKFRKVMSKATEANLKKVESLYGGSRSR